MMPRPTTRLILLTLEDRTAPANFHIDNLSLVDGNAQPLSTVPVGEQIYARVDWSFTGMTAGTNYVIRYHFNGEDFDSGEITTVNGDGSGWWWYRGLWLAQPGDNTITATVDGRNDVPGETDETDNTMSLTFTASTPTGPSVKFLWPVSRKPQQVDAISNYTDVDPRTGSSSDYRGGPFTYDGHDAFDIYVPGFVTTDAGIPVVAAADGTVVDVEDGNYDRDTAMLGQPANYVVIDHADGWRTTYYHFAENSITVKIGDTVKAGQLIGMMGSSGNSTGPHLHFNIQHNFATVETMYGPSAYFIDPPVYEGDDRPVVTASGVTNYDPFTTGDYAEGTSGVSVFPTSQNWDVYSWVEASVLPQNQPVFIDWYRPDSSQPSGFSLYRTNTFTPTGIGGGWWYWSLEPSAWASYPGTWQVVWRIGGQARSRNQFVVTSGVGEPEIRVRSGSSLILDDRTTPLDFGSTPQGGVKPQQTYTIENHGSALLTMDELQLPTGFDLVGTFPDSVAAGSSATFTVELDSTEVGDKYGAIRFTTNDADEGRMEFLIKGTVTGTPISGDPEVTLPSPAVPFEMGDSPQFLDPNATLVDGDDSDYNGATLAVDVELNGNANDRLGISGDGQISISGNAILDNDTPIGTFTGGDGFTPLSIAFSAGSTPTSAEDVLRDVTYQNIATRLDGRPRFLLVELTDPEGHASDVDVKRVSLYMDTVNDAPVVNASTPILSPILEDATNPAGQTVVSFTESGVSDADGFDPKGIAVTGLGNAEDGKWQYSWDGGVNWRNIGSVSASAALLLRETDLVRFLPAANANGTATLTYLAWDQSTGLYGSTVDLTVPGATGGATAFSFGTQTADLAITPVNDAPTFTRGSNKSALEDSGVSTFSGWATGISAGPPNESGQTLTFEVTADDPSLFAVQPAVAADGTLSFTPAPNQNGIANLIIQLKDDGGTDNGGHDTSSTQSFKITIIPVNDAPSFTIGPNIRLDDESGDLQTIGDWAKDILAGPRDEAGQALNFEITGNTNPSLFAAAPTVDAAGTLTYQAAANAHGYSTITLHLKDNGGTANGGADTSADQTFEMAINSPSARDDDVSTKVGKAITIPVLANDAADPAGQLTLISFTTPRAGRVRRVGDNLIYTPSLPWGGTDSLTYQVSDGLGGFDVGTVTIHVIDTIAPKVLAVRLYYGPLAYVDLQSLSRSVLPYVGISKVVVQFSEPVTVDQSDLTLTGIRNGNYGASSFAYDPDWRTATWLLSTPVADDRATLSLARSIADTTSNLLGGWARSFGVLEGDFNGDGVVTDADAMAIKKKISKKRASNHFADISGDGFVSLVDYELAKQRKGHRLP
jgi:murein DD-endopeptidase MepM/ murein hydrolase activator NlpD